MAEIPDRAAAENARGNERRAAGDLAGAEAGYRRALSLRPDYRSALYNLGLTLAELGRSPEAEQHFRRLLELEPEDAEARVHLATLLLQRSAAIDARAVLERGIGTRPDSPELHFLHGQACRASGDRETARLALKTALRLDPGAEIYAALGEMLLDEGAGQEAATCFAEAVRLLPGRADFHNGLGAAQRLAAQSGLAVRSFREALRLEPDLSPARLNLGDCHLERGEPAEAAECFAEGLRRQPDSAAFTERLLFARQQLCDWSGFDELRSRRLAHANGGAQESGAPFSLLTVDSSPALQLACARAMAGRLQRRVKDMVLPAVARDERRFKERLRVGYLSSDLHAHVTAYLLADLFEHHDRSAVDVFAYSCGPDDGGELRARIRRSVEHFVDVAPLEDRAAAQRIRDDRIDVLLDVNGYTQGARNSITALRPAPVQVNYLGYPGTMGAEFIDYIVVDHFVFRDGDRRHFTEQPVFMPGCYAPAAPVRRAAPPSSRAQLGLPEGAFVACCFNQAFKIMPEVFGLWMRFLDAAPHAVLWLLEGNPAACGNLRAEAARRGIESSRLIFAPRVSPAEYLGRLAAADLFLDTFPYNAHTTAADALWAGVPVLTRSGESFASRVAGSMLEAVGLSELITDSPQEYQALALALAADPARVAGLKRALAANRASAPLFDLPSYARNLEAACLEMRARWLSGRMPEAIEL